MKTIIDPDREGFTTRSLHEELVEDAKHCLEKARSHFAELVTRKHRLDILGLVSRETGVSTARASVELQVQLDAAARDLQSAERHLLAITAPDISQVEPFIQGDAEAEAYAEAVFRAHTRP